MFLGKCHTIKHTYVHSVAYIPLLRSNAMLQSTYCMVVLRGEMLEKLKFNLTKIGVIADLQDYTLIVI